mmetsp:Transcript_12166/g.33745  ORF Transcript_12166/g.33745 Transcript_12166/m.33745 type:complete len:514 (-) Transcript_12166:215-1756(-)
MGTVPKKRVPGKVSPTSRDLQAPSLDDDDSSSDDDEEVIVMGDEDDEELVSEEEEESSSYEELEVEDDDDESTVDELADDVDLLEVDDSSDDDDEMGSDSEFEELPPPIDIPKELLPKNLRSSEHSHKKKKGLYDGSSSDDDSDDTDTSGLAFDDDDIYSPRARATRNSVDKSIATSISEQLVDLSDSDLSDDSSEERRKGRQTKSNNSKKDDKNDSSGDDEEVKRKPRWAAADSDDEFTTGISRAAVSTRPGTFRGTSFDSDDGIAEQLRQAAVHQRRGGKKSDAQESPEIPSPKNDDAPAADDSDSSVDGEPKRKPRWAAADSDDEFTTGMSRAAVSKRPGTFRGTSFDSDDGMAEQLRLAVRRGGKKSDADENDGNDEEAEESRADRFRGQSERRSGRRPKAEEAPAPQSPTNNNNATVPYSGKVWQPPKKKEKKVKQKKAESDDEDDPNGEYYPLDDVRKMTIPDLDYKNREKYLNGKDFKKAFGVRRKEYDTWPKWKQTKAKRTAKLF